MKEVAVGSAQNILQDTLQGTCSVDEKEPAPALVFGNGGVSEHDLAYRRLLAGLDESPASPDGWPPEGWPAGGWPPIEWLPEVHYNAALWETA